MLLISSSAFILFKPSPKGTKAEISIDGEVVMSVDLHEDREISLKDFGRDITLKIKDGKVRFLSSDCPNKTCVNTGYINKKGQTAICLPNKTAVTVL